MLDTQSTIAPIKKIKFDRATKDYSLFINGEYVGSAETYDEGQRRLDEIVHSQLAHGN